MLPAWRAIAAVGAPLGHSVLKRSAVHKHLRQLQLEAAHFAAVVSVVRPHHQQAARVAEPQTALLVEYGSAVDKQRRHHAVGAAVFHPLAALRAAEDAVARGQPQTAVAVLYHGARLLLAAERRVERTEFGHAYVRHIYVAMLGQEIQAPRTVLEHFLELAVARKTLGEHTAADGAPGRVVHGQPVLGAYPAVALGIEEDGVDVAGRQRTVVRRPVPRLRSFAEMVQARRRTAPQRAVGVRRKAEDVARAEGIVIGAGSIAHGARRRVDYVQAAAVGAHHKAAAVPHGRYYHVGTQYRRLYEPQPRGSIVALVYYGHAVARAHERIWPVALHHTHAAAHCVEARMRVDRKKPGGIERVRRA